MTGQQTPPAGRRVDAERNRQKILTVARAAFDGADDGVPMAEIARRSGVGMATLYRNFPGRAELLEALYTDEVDAVCAAAASAVGATPGERFVAWLGRFISFSAGKRPIAAQLLRQSGRTHPLFDSSRDRVIAAGGPLLDDAQAAGEIRPDLRLEQVLDMVVAVTSVAGPDGYVDPMLATVLAGLRTT